MLIETRAVGVFRCNCTIVACQATREAIIIDPGDEPDQILLIVRRHRLNVRRVVHTHAHIDHIMGTYAIVEATGASAHLHDGDRYLWEHVGDVAATYHFPAPKRPSLGHPLEDDETIRFGQELAIALRDGATLLLSGDTLFRGHVGVRAPDNARNLETIVTSIRKRLFTLHDDTRVITGHGPETSIGSERNNAIFRKRT
jgi:glyoxylase-like metal-dependent hydrolase (beta-lactamase superfamily II)